MGVLSPQFGSLIPSLQPQALQTNYLNFAGAGGVNFAQQYLPEIYEQEIERYGNRTLSGFLRMVGAEMPMTSDQVIWSEQNRLHIAYDNVTLAADGITMTIVGGAANTTLTNSIFPNMTVVVMDPNNPAFTVKGIVGSSGASTNNPAADVAVTAQQFSVYPYTQAFVSGAAAVAAAGLKVFVYGSDYAKGSAGPGSAGQSTESITPQLTTFTNSPIIIRNRYAVNGSDTAQIGWVEVATEDGTSGYLWYLKAEGETRLRFEDYLEMAMIEGEQIVAGSGFRTVAANVVYSFSGAAGANNLPTGTEGLFAAINNGGNILSGYAGSLQDFDSVLENLDSQGAIEENMLFLDRKTCLLYTSPSPRD